MRMSREWESRQTGGWARCASLIVDPLLQQFSIMQTEWHFAFINCTSWHCAVRLPNRWEIKNSLTFLGNVNAERRWDFHFRKEFLFIFLWILQNCSTVSDGRPNEGCALCWNSCHLTRNRWCCFECRPKTNSMLRMTDVAGYDCGCCRSGHAVDEVKTTNWILFCF